VRQPSHRALKAEERQEILDLFHSNRFIDTAPGALYATLLGEGTYLCSTRTMYRILGSNNEVKERRAQRQRPNYSKPELVATGPNQVWSWDITKLRGAARLQNFSLYVMIDIFSRLVVGWLVADGEHTSLAIQLMRSACEKQGIQPDTLTLHSDRGSVMTSGDVADLLSSLGIVKTHSRPYTSNDNPFSEAHFKTLKYGPDFPKTFGSIEDAKSFCRSFFDWYNTKHCHSGIAYFTPEQLHYGEAFAIQEKRKAALLAAYTQNPERFVKGMPQPPEIPEAVWINPPDQQKEKELLTTS
jgi:putative transposase